MPVAVVQAPPAVELEEAPLTRRDPSPSPGAFAFCNRPAVFLPALTFAALLIHGYHPYVDDAAIYVAGIEKIVRPALYPHHAEYVLPHLKHSVLSLVLGYLIRLSRLSVTSALFTSYVASLWLMLFACWRLVRVLFSRMQERWGAMLLITAALTMPVAGSAIFFIDPYVTARSFSTPATLLAIAFTLERRILAAVVCLAGAFLLHPLMAAYAIGYVVALMLVQRQRWEWLGISAAAVFLIGLAAAHHYRLAGVSPAYRMAAASRIYFFLDSWTWFEIFGLFPPLLAAAMYLKRDNSRPLSSLSCISAASLYTGLVALLFAMLFTRTPASFMLARLQPLRAFQLIYILFFLLLGGLLGGYTFRRRRWWVGAVAIGSVAVAMVLTQLCVYPSLRHVEWPWIQPKNPWEQAFLWIRGNTPIDAFFALDPSYQSQPQEDTVGFRAMTERSVLPDWSKDGGIAAIDPALAGRWWTETQATRHFAQWSDSQRIAHLRPYYVSWIVLSASAATAFQCPYRNSRVLVCQLPSPPPSQR